MEYIVNTDRLGLRKFRHEDLAEFAELNADPEVMQFFPATPSKEQSLAFMERANANIDEYGFGFWAAEILECQSFVGFVGIQRVPYETAFTPAVEIGWRLARLHWGKGLATEAAHGCLKFGFEVANLRQIVSFTAIINRRSYAVMEKLGMTRVGEFDHPKIDDGHPLQRHVLYRIKREEYGKL